MQYLRVLVTPLASLAFGRDARSGGASDRRSTRTAADWGYTIFAGAVGIFLARLLRLSAASLLRPLLAPGL